MSEAKPAAAKPAATKPTASTSSLKKAGSGTLEPEKKPEQSTKSIKEQSTGRSVKQGAVDKSSKSLLLDGGSEKSSPRLPKAASPSIPIELVTVANKISKMLHQLADEFEVYIHQELTMINTDQEVKTLLEKSHNFGRVQECLLSSGLLGCSSAFTAVHTSLTQYKSLIANKTKKPSKEMSTTPANHKTTADALEAEIKQIFAAKLKEEDAAKKKGIEVLTTADFDEGKFQRSLSASYIKPAGNKPAAVTDPKAIIRENWPGIEAVSFSTVDAVANPHKKIQRSRLRLEYETYKENFDLNFQKAFYFKPLDAIYAVRQEYYDPLNTLTICGFSINSRGKIMDYSLSAGTIKQEHSSDCSDKPSS